MGNLRKRIQIRVVKNSQDFIKYTSRPTCVNWKVFENNLAAIHEKKICLALNKPIYVGFTVLETSKWEMYNFSYNLMIIKFNTGLLFTDKNSLCYKIHGKKPLKQMYKYKKLFDLSNFPKSSKYENKKIIGKMKDEYGGKSILKFIGLKSKIHLILDESSNEKSANKGCNAFKEFQEFHDTLFQKKILRQQMREIKSKNHNLSTYKAKKILLSCFDDRRYILRNGIEIFAYGHKDIKMINLDSINNENNKKHYEK